MNAIEPKFLKEFRTKDSSDSQRKPQGFGGVPCHGGANFGGQKMVNKTHR